MCTRRGVLSTEFHLRPSATRTTVSDGDRNAIAVEKRVHAEQRKQLQVDDLLLRYFIELRDRMQNQQGLSCKTHSEFCPVIRIPMRRSSALLEASGDAHQNNDKKQKSSAKQEPLMSPGEKRISNGVDHKFFVWIPLRHPLRALCCGQLRAVGCRRMVLFLFVSGNKFMTILTRSGSGNCSCFVGERTLVRKHVMKPLRKEPSMQFHFPVARNRGQLGCQSAHQFRFAVVIDGYWRCQTLHHTQDFEVCCLRSTDCSLYVSEDIFAQIRTADKIVRSGHNTIGHSLHVV
mmetsp:Transcript_34107/g.90969  ORF Transcript_34107/g.90969 Transcript_34107/m.90969 type:complete len:289 (-) Transcript_34107:1099-1965(-)